MLDVRYSTKFKKDFKSCVKRGYKMSLLQQVIDTVHEARTQNVAGTVLQVVNQLRNGFEWASQEIRQLADRAKQAIHHHIHRHR